MAAVIARKKRKRLEQTRASIPSQILLFKSAMKMPEISCDHHLLVASNTVMPPFKLNPIRLLLFFILLVQIKLHRAHLPAPLNQYQLVGQASEEAHLPCLIGRQIYCGEPYFMAWYKLNSTTKIWTRIEHKSEQELAGESTNELAPQSSAPPSASALSKRVHFSWWRPGQATRRQPGARSACQQKAGLQFDSEAKFDCAQLTIRALELPDEGQYKCEITFSESLDFDNCPTTTLSHLSVIARPNEPEIMLNGRQLANGSVLTFKEGAQVKLECLSNGGRPAPRIEWLNVSSVLAPDGEGGVVELMRSHWPHKKATYLEGNGTLAGQARPVTYSSVIISLSRYDLGSRFLCLLVPQLEASSQAVEVAYEQLMKNAGYVSSLLAQQQHPNTMHKWIKLDVQVKPRSVSVHVKEVQTNTSLATLREHHLGQSYFSLQPNQMYAIQCVVDNSRPASQVTWFNRTTPVVAEQMSLTGPLDYLMPEQKHRHRVSSFVRSLALANGAFRTTATLLLTTNIWDNLEELFCRVSNEAFGFDELIQETPILPVTLYVNYAPLAWLEADAAKWTPDQQAGQLELDTGGSVSLRCSVAANPLGHNTILQIEWLKDGHKLGQRQHQQQAASSLHIEKANHLHMPVPLGAAPSPSGSSKLLGSSSLSISSAAKSDSGAYTCHYKLIPAPSAPGPQLHQHQHQQQHQQIKITSGQANQTIQVNVIEAKPRTPTLRISASIGLLLYGPQSPAGGPPRKQPPLTVLTDASATVSLKCDLSSTIQATLGHIGHKIMWYVNGAFLHSSTGSEIYNFTLDSLTSQARHLGSLSCAYHALGASSSSLDNFNANLMRVYHSSNTIELKLKVAPKLLSRRELMPQVRSFSELELNANSASKLRLVCLAQCEPLCSIDWYIDQHRIEASETSQKLATTTRHHLSLPQANQSTEQVYHSVRELSHQMLGSLVALETLAHRANETAFSWLKETSLSHQEELATDGQLIWSLPKTDKSPWLLNGANVFSKLEITYNQIGQLLSRATHDEVTVKCKLNRMLNGLDTPSSSTTRAGASLQTNSRYSSASDGAPANGWEIPQFGYAFVERSHWFPALETQTQRYQFALSNEPINLTAALFDTQKESNDNGFSSPDSKEDSQEQSSSLFADEMQIRILSDKPPKSVSISFAGIVSTDQKPAEVSLSETQLSELLDINTKVAPLLQCRSPNDHVNMAAQFRWTFSGLNGIEHLTLTDGPELNLRQWFQTRQHQLNLTPITTTTTTTYGLDVVESLVGNYTCTVANLNGVKQASMAFQIKGRPMCKMVLANEHLDANLGLMANLQCSIYSSPALLETVWLKGSQQLAVNKTNLETLLSWTRSAKSIIELQVIVSKKHQDLTQFANFKCIARNSLGYSEACELKQSDKDILLRTVNSNGVLNLKSPAISMSSSNYPDLKQDPLNFILNTTATDSSQPVSSVILSLITHPDWLLAITCCLALAGLFFAIGFTLFGRRFIDSAKLRTNLNQNTHWRFNSARNNTTNNVVGAPFQSKICVSYYSGSNGDSEHDMIQSCSQSSHYEDLVQLHQQKLMNQQQPIYLNGHLSTLGRSALKTSLSTSSNCDSRAIGQMSTLRDFSDSTFHSHPPNSAATMRADLSVGNRSNLPLVNGTNNSRIRLEHHQVRQPQAIRFNNREQQTFGSHSRNEPIYDDVIYNQMIL